MSGDVLLVRLLQILFFCFSCFIDNLQPVKCQITQFELQYRRMLIILLHTHAQKISLTVQLNELLGFVLHR